MLPNKINVRAKLKKYSSKHADVVSHGGDAVLVFILMFAAVLLTPHARTLFFVWICVSREKNIFLSDQQKISDDLFFLTPGYKVGTPAYTESELSL